MSEGRKVAVIAGGDSLEREISLRSGEAVAVALRSVAKEMGISKVCQLDPCVKPVDFVRRLASCDVAFPILHGAGGEDGQIQGVLEYLEVPYSGSGIQASSIAIDKVATKRMWLGAGLRTPAYRPYVLTRDTIESCVRDILSWSCQAPLIIKPRSEGSSFLMYKVESECEIREALRENLAMTSVANDVLVEQWIEGDEYTVGFVGDQILPTIKIETTRPFYDYDAKYVSNDTRYLCPSGLDDRREQDFAQLAVDAYQCIGCEGWGRVDVICDAKGEKWLVEINTLPGMTEHSLVPMAAKKAGLSFVDLVLKILATASLKQ